MNFKLLSRFKHLHLTIIMLSVSCFVMAQRTVSGKVVSGENQQPVVGASVTLKGGKKSTLTDAAGNMSAAVTKPFADTSAPAAPTVTTTPNANGTLTVSGTAEPGSTAKITFPDGTTATVPVGPNVPG